jgi:hypothetical protein
MIWSERCNNPRDGYTIQPDGSMRMNAPLGNWVMSYDEAVANARWNKK